MVPARGLAPTHMQLEHLGQHDHVPLQRAVGCMPVATYSIPTDAFRQISDHSSMGMLREGSARNTRSRFII
jgi:hypothetical protein